MRYTAFGETRYENGVTPTDYRYTGQREEAELGLYYYVARWYDPALGRFTQADKIVPNPGSAKAYDRYAYVNNNPLKYVDPSGHGPCEGALAGCKVEPWPEDEDGDDGGGGGGGGVPDYPSVEEIIKEINLVFQGGIWNNEEYMKYAAWAVFTVGSALAVAGFGDTPSEAFRNAYGITDSNPFVFSLCTDCSGFARTKGGNEIAFKRFYRQSGSAYPNKDIPESTINVRFVIHELGHAFGRKIAADFGIENPYEGEFTPYGFVKNNFQEYNLGRPAYESKKEGGYYGFAGGVGEWQFALEANVTHYDDIWADMFLGWVYDSMGTDRTNFMNMVMPQFIPQG